MKIIKYGQELVFDQAILTEGPTIFLGGPTVRGNQQHLTSWRIEATDLFAARGFNGTLIVPEWVDKTATDKGWETILVPWEFMGLELADCIMFWIPRTRELIALTTNHEFGYWLAKEREKMIYGRPDDAYRMGYLDEMWRIDSSDFYKPIKGTREIYHNLPDTVTAAMILADKRYRDRH